MQRKQWELIMITLIISLTVTCRSGRSPQCHVSIFCLLCLIIWLLQIKIPSFSCIMSLSCSLQKIELPQMENIQTIPPPFVVRTLLVFSRHAGMLQFNPPDAVKVSLSDPSLLYDHGSMTRTLFFLDLDLFVYSKIHKNTQKAIHTYSDLTAPLLWTCFLISELKNIRFCTSVLIPEVLFQKHDSWSLIKKL